MTTVRVLSDLHIEGTYFKYEPHDEEVLVLAGDIGTGMRGIKWALENVPDSIPVVMVPGNHEYYQHDYTMLNLQFVEHNKKNTHVHMLMEDVFVHKNLEFVGTTLWTDFDLYRTQHFAEQSWLTGLNDSRLIKDRGTNIRANHFKQWHKKSMKFLNRVVSKPTELIRILVTHYCNSWSVSDHWKLHPCTPGFAVVIPADVHEKFAFHFHGHTHDNFDYEMPYGTRVICNPRGYRHESSLNGFNPDLILDI